MIEGSPRRAVTAALLWSLMAVAVSAGSSLALFADTTPVPANVFTTIACFDRASVQTGTATSSANGTLTVPISAVTPARSFLIFNTRHSSNRPVGSMVRGRIATSTSLEFVRVTDEATPVAISIQWYVVQYDCGVNVQRGQVTQTATTLNVPITPVASLSQAFVTWSKTPASTDLNWNADDPVVGELTTTSNLQFRVNTAASTHIIWWQVIEFTNAANINVQKGSTSLLGTGLSTTITLGTPVDVSKTFVLVGFRSAGTGADVGSRMLRAQLTNSTTITVDRSISGTPDDITEIVWQAVELKDGSTVQRGSESFVSGDPSNAVPISSINTSRAAAFASVQAVGGQNMGRSPYAGDDIIGVGSFTMALSATLLTIDRTNTAAAADVGWFVVEFGRP
ncbi:MAG: hypothetical protein ACT4PO_11270 [Actinomycetota bacterium]